MCVFAAAALPALTPGLMAGLSIASTAATLYGQQQAAKAQADANKAAYNNQMTAYRYNQAQNNFSRVQEAEGLAETKVANNAAAVRAMSRARAIAGEGGVTGLSVDALLADLGGRAGADNSNAEVNYLRRDNAIGADMTRTWAKTASEINTLKTPQQPDYFGAALRIGQAYNTYKSS